LSEIDASITIEILTNYCFVDRNSSISVIFEKQLKFKKDHNKPFRASHLIEITVPESVQAIFVIVLVFVVWRRWEWLRFGGVKEM
jgi:hypothetical protein